MAKAATVSIIGVYPPSDWLFHIGMAMNKNLTLRMGNANHRRKYFDVLIEPVSSGQLDPIAILTEHELASGAVASYEAFDKRQLGWIKVELEHSA